MTGLFLLAVLGVWLAVATFVARMIGRFFKSQFKKIAAVLISFMLVLVLPFSDELIGVYQMNSLCSKNGFPPMAAFEKQRGRTLVSRMSLFKPVPGTLLETEMAEKTYVDELSGEVVIRFSIYRVRGGWLIRGLGISENNSPLIVSASCGGVGGYPL